MINVNIFEPKFLDMFSLSLHKKLIKVNSQLKTLPCVIIAYDIYGILIM